ncbi:MAG TPA: MerR family transcriptional regulator [Rhodospirillaceae bacterium]|nr:MerR family transcriptional regulator [Rhodospirillaceae bacterium]
MTDISIATKADSAFRTISEVAEDLGVQQHVLRFWETKFTQVKPLKRGGGRRYYRPEDVALLKKIHTLLYAEGYTIKGVQKLLKGVSKTQVLAEQKAEQASKLYGENLPKVEAPVQQAAHPADDSEHVLVLKSVLEELLDMRAQVETLLAERDNRNDEAA